MCSLSPHCLVLLFVIAWYKGKGKLLKFCSSLCFGIIPPFQEPRLRSGVKMLLGLLEELRLSFGRCPPVLAPMMDMRRETLGRCLSDGLSGVITWNSTSIDTFLHSARENIMATVDYSKLLEREMKLIARATGKLQQFQLLSEPLVLSLGPLVSGDTITACNALSLLLVVAHTWQCVAV